MSEPRTAFIFSRSERRTLVALLTLHALDADLHDAAQALWDGTAPEVRLTLLRKVLCNASLHAEREKERATT